MRGGGWPYRYNHRWVESGTCGRGDLRSVFVFAGALRYPVLDTR
jgi:hypothetical protein